MEQRVHLKVVLLGQTCSGKTCLVKRYMEGNFDNQVHASVGCAFAARSVHVRGVELCFGIWDTCGQERYETLTRIYYKNAAAAIVCHDVTDRASFDKTAFWIDELKEHNEDCRIYLTSTKIDLLEVEGLQRSVDRDTIDDTAREVNATVIETSSKTGENIEDLFMTIGEDFVTAGLHKKKRERSIKLHEPPSPEVQNEIRKSGCRCYRGGRKHTQDDGPT